MVGKFMSTTKILGEAVGIQRQDIIDQTEEQLADSLSSATILGRFRQGRLDKPMTIHQGNIRGQLGYDPKNPDYIAVQDCLDAGVPSVQVLRIAGQSGENCTPSLKISPYLMSDETNDAGTRMILHWTLEIDGVVATNGISANAGVNLEDYLYENSETLGITGSYIEEDGVIITNITDTHKNIRLIPRLFDEPYGFTITDVPFEDYMTFSENPSVQMNAEGVISFCLSAAKP